MIQYFTDGSTRGKNQKGADNMGGFGVVVFNSINDNDVIDLISSQHSCTTNNRMELEAIIWAMEHADYFYPNEKCVIYSDSAYAVNMINSWIHNWAANGWKNSKKQIVENLDLVQTIYSKITKDFYHCSVEKVSGHSDNIGNELADALATDNIKKFKNICEENLISIKGVFVC